MVSTAHRGGFSLRLGESVVADLFPLFPLQTVLVPGAALGLRIFETRYLDLVRDCGRSGTGFGICLILDGDEAGAPAAPAAVGTEARIEPWPSNAIQSASDIALNATGLPISTKRRDCILPAPTPPMKSRSTGPTAVPK